MSDVFWLGKGAVLGFSIAAPVGPIGLLCVRRTLEQGRMAGFVSGLGAATADFVYGCAAALGLASAAGALSGSDRWLRVVSALFVVWLGWKAMQSKPPESGAKDGGGRKLAEAYFTTFALTVVNPMTILTFAAMFTSMGLASAAGKDGFVLAGGVLLGSAAWWILLALIAGAFRSRLTRTHMVWINRVSGTMLIVLGLAGVWSAV